LSAKGVANEPIAVQIAQPAIMLGVGKPANLPEQETPGIFGDELILKAWSLPETATPSESIPITLGWQTTSRQISRSYSFGIYAFSSAGEFLAQSDSPLNEGRLFSFSLPVNYYFEDTKKLVMPNQSDSYSLFVGVYDMVTMERLPVSG